MFTVHINNYSPIKPWKSPCSSGCSLSSLSAFHWAGVGEEAARMPTNGGGCSSIHFNKSERRNQRETGNASVLTSK